MPLLSSDQSARTDEKKKNQANEQAVREEKGPKGIEAGQQRLSFLALNGGERASERASKRLEEEEGL